MEHYNKRYRVIKLAKPFDSDHGVIGYYDTINMIKMNLKNVFEYDIDVFDRKTEMYYSGDILRNMLDSNTEPD